MNNNQTIIIFEGHDMTGKSNIAKQLSAKLNIPVFKFTKQHDGIPDFLNMLHFTAQCQTQICQQTNYSFIFDRFVGSEYAYAKFNNRPTDENKIFNLDSRLGKLNTIIIYCYKDEDKYIDDDLGRYTTDDYNKIKTYYNQFLFKSKCKWIGLNTSQQNIKEQLQFILFQLYENDII